MPQISPISSNESRLHDLDLVAIASLALALLLLCALAGYLGSLILPQLPFVVVFLLCLFGLVPLLGLLLIKNHDELTLGQGIFITYDSDPHWYRRAPRKA